MSNIPEGCKPFNLQEALAGEPVVTRDGRKVKISGYNPEAQSMHKIVGWANNASRSWGEDGSFNGCESHPADLFMAPDQRDVWVVLWSAKVNEDIRSTAYEDENTAVKMSLSAKNGGSIIYGIHKITITL